MKLSQEKLNTLEAQAADVLAEVYGEEQIVPPVDLGKVAKKYGLSLKKVNFSEPDALGQLDRVSKTIYVADGEYFPRVSFTIAHELGHYILHKDKQKDTFWRLDTVNLEMQDKTEEAEANTFAASLLMPKPLIEIWWSKTKDVTLMASVFGVSQAAMAYRLKNLGLTDYAC